MYHMQYNLIWGGTLGEDWQWDGSPISVLSKQKLDTRSSTKSEIVGVDQLMPSVLWTRIFLKSQVYGVTENIIYQDNKSDIITEKNGKSSSS